MGTLGQSTGPPTRPGAKMVPQVRRSLANLGITDPGTQKKNFLDDLSNSVWPFDYIVKAGQPARQKVFPGRCLSEKFANRMSIPRHSVRLISRAAPRNRASQLSRPSAAKLLYKSSGPDTVSAQHSRRTKSAS